MARTQVAQVAAMARAMANWTRAARPKPASVARQAAAPLPVRCSSPAEALDQAIRERRLPHQRQAGDQRHDGPDHSDGHGQPDQDDDHDRPPGQAGGDSPTARAGPHAGDRQST